MRRPGHCFKNHTQKDMLAVGTYTALGALFHPLSEAPPVVPPFATLDSLVKLFGGS